MLEISANKNSLSHLFDLKTANSPMLFSVLKGLNPGKSLVDNLDSPTTCVVRNNEGWTFACRNINEDLLRESIHEYLKYGKVRLVWNEDTRLIPPKADNRVERLEFTKHTFDAQLTQYLVSKLPSDFQIVSMDLQLLENCIWRDRVITACGTPENFIKNGLGFCIINKSVIVTEAYAPFFGETTAELGVVTNKKYRGKGFATIVCAHLIDKCKEKGYSSYWSCDKDNSDSIRVAKKLGFGGEKDYRLLVYNQPVIK